MKPPERFHPEDPREWMNRARSNLAMAKNRVPQAYLEDLCFEAQQAAEKEIKAVMIARGIDFPYTHNLARLLTILESHTERIQIRFDEPCNLRASPYIRDIPVLKSRFPSRNTPKR